MALLGKFFKGAGERDDGSGNRSKRGRAPSIRRDADGSPAGADAPLPEINIDDIEKARQANAGPPKREAGAGPDQASRAEKPAEKPPIEIDLSAPKPAAGPKAPPAPRPETTAPPRPGKAAGAAGVPGPTAGEAVKRSTRLQSRQKPIGELLIQAGTVSTEQLSRALKIQDKGGKGLVGQILSGMGACPHAAIMAALNRQFRISTVELDRVEISPAVAVLVPTDKCREHRLIPFEKIGTTLCISMANCLNRKAINEVEELTKLKVKPFNSTWIEIRKAIEVVEKAGLVAPAASEAAVAGDEESPAAPDQEPVSPTSAGTELQTASGIQATDAAMQMAPEVSAGGGEPKPASAARAADEAGEPPPFVGPAKARIEGLDTFDTTEAEVVQETERGLASKHQDEIRRRRTERQKIMGTGQGVVGRLVAPDLDAYLPEGDAGADAESPSALVKLRVVDEQLLAGANLPTARQLAANAEEFRSPAPAAMAAPAPAAPEAGPEPVTGSEETSASSGDEVAAGELPSVPAISFKPEEAGELVPLRISDAEWAAMEADLEPDPVVTWLATYASAGPVPAAQSWL